MVSPPKPWERGVVAAATTPSAPQTTLTSTSAPQPTSAQVPERPSPLPSTVASQNALQVANPYSSYSSPYSRFGALGSSYSPYGGGFGSYGSMGYGGLGSYGGYGGLGSYGGYGMAPGMLGPNGLPPGPGNPQSLTQTLESTTQHTFALIHSIVQTFSGVAQMLESTFFATHSSFFAMVGVIDQFGQLRNALGSVLGLFGLVRWLQGVLTGRGRESQEMRTEFKDFIMGKPVTPSQKGSAAPAPKPSKKPLILFLIAVVAVPYVVSKLIRALNARQLTDSSSSTAALPAPPPSQIDPSKLQFARALYPFEASSPTELGLKENEIVAIMGKLDPATGAEVDPRWTGESEWWRGRTRDGREGWFPRKWVEILERREPKKID